MFTVISDQLVLWAGKIFVDGRYFATFDSHTTDHAHTTLQYRMSYIYEIAINH